MRRGWSAGSSLCGAEDESSGLELFVAYCADVPGANGQGKTHEECLANLREAIALILEHRREESLRALPPDARQEPVIVG